MTLIDAVFPRADLVGAAVSILVFLDDAHRHFDAPAVSPRAFVFQSLFSWMTLIDVRDQHADVGDVSGFNPCFLG